MELPMTTENSILSSILIYGWTFLELTRVNLKLFNRSESLENFASSQLLPYNSNSTNLSTLNKPPRRASMEFNNRGR